MNNILGIDSTLDEMYLSQALYNRTIHFITEFNREECYKAIYLMERIERLDDEENLPMDKRIITIVLNSYGGVCYDYLAWCSVVERLKEKGYIIKVHTQGVSMSCGFMQQIIGSKGYRTMARHSYLMCHQISGGQGYCTIQDSKEIQEHSEDLWNKFKTLILQNTNITDEQLEDMRSRKLDWYMDAEEALRLGCIDEII